MKAQHGHQELRDATAISLNGDRERISSALAVGRVSMWIYISFEPQHGILVQSATVFALYLRSRI